MERIRQILVPVDFSESSAKALDYAANLAKSLGASVDLLHVWEAPAFVPTGNVIAAGAGDMSLVEWVRKHANEALADFVKKAAERGISVRFARAEPGPPAHTITEYAKSNGYDLIVIGTRGRTGLSRVLLGSVAENVVRHAPCPVLAVRAQSEREG